MDSGHFRTLYIMNGKDMESLSIEACNHPSQSYRNLRNAGNNQEADEATHAYAAADGLFPCEKL